MPEPACGEGLNYCQIPGADRRRSSFLSSSRPERLAAESRDPPAIAMPAAGDARHSVGPGSAAPRAAWPSGMTTMEGMHATGRKGDGE